MKVVLINAISIDGRTAKGTKDPIDWTSKEDKKFFAEETKKAGVVIMGSNTFKAIGKTLSGRLNIVFSSKAKSYKSTLGILEFTNQKPEVVLKDLKKRGFEKVMLIGGSTLNTSFFMLIGGSTLNTSFLKKDLIDEIWLTIEPVLLGEGLSLFKNTEYSGKIKLISVNRLGDKSVVLKYNLRKK
jgi:dihydrofolate reductase